MDTKTESEKLDTWALVELFGHQRIVGKVTEASIAGGAFLRVDVPAFEENKAFTRFYGPGAIYSINPVAEEIAMGLMRNYRHEPVSRFDFPQIADKVAESDEDPGRMPEDEESEEEDKGVPFE